MQQLPPGFVIDAPRPGGGADPVKVRQEQRADEDQGFQRNTDARSADAAARAAQAAILAERNAAIANQIKQQDMQMQLATKGLMLSPDGQIVANPNGPIGASDNDKGADAKAGAYNSVIQQIDRLYELYNDGPGATKGASAIWDYLPTDANAAFDTAGAALGDQGNAAFKVPGMGAQSDADAARFVAANQPSSGDRDVAALEKLRALRQRLENNMAAQGLPAPVWNYGLDGKPVQGNQRDETPAGVNKTQIPFSGGRTPPPDPKKTLGTEKLYSTDDDMAQNAELESAFDRGASFQELMAIKQRHVKDGNASPWDPATVLNIGTWLRARDSGTFGKDYGNLKYRKDMQHFSPAQSGRRNDLEIGLNKALLHPAGTALTTATSALGLGALEALAPDAIAQQRETNPMSAFAGDVTGMIGGTSLLAKAGEKAASKFAPQLLGGGGKAQFARSIAPDMAYGAAYGGMTQGDPLTGAVAAGAGNLGGRAIGKTLGGMIGGVDDPAVKYLTERNIPLSPGQVLGNRGMIGRMYSKMESAPIVGDLMARNRVDGLKAFEREALNDVVQPIGGRVTQGGADGLMEAQGAVSNAYGDALSGVNIAGDGQFIDEAGQALNRGSQIPSVGEEFRYSMDNRVGPMFEGGTLSGPELQQALQQLGAIRSDFAKQGPMGQFAADATDEIDDALYGLVGRQAPDVMPKYDAAKGAYSRLAPFENARIGAINQEAITPAQLSRAVTNNTKKFGGRASAATEKNISDLMKYGQEVLPSTIPNSGTAERLGGLSAMLLPTALGGGAYGVSTLTDNPGYAVPLATLAALSTKTGQKAFQAAATKRPKSARRIAGIFGGQKAQKGLAGMITAPLLVND